MGLAFTTWEPRLRFFQWWLCGMQSTDSHRAPSLVQHPDDCEKVALDSLNLSKMRPGQARNVECRPRKCFCPTPLIWFYQYVALSYQNKLFPLLNKAGVLINVVGGRWPTLSVFAGAGWDGMHSLGFGLWRWGWYRWVGKHKVLSLLMGFLFLYAFSVQGRLKHRVLHLFAPKRL